MKNILYIIPFLGLVSCMSPLDKEYEMETSLDDFKRIVLTEKIDTAEAKLMAEYMVDNKLLEPQVLELGFTYRDILNQAKSDKKWKDQMHIQTKGSKEGLMRDSLELIEELQNSIVASIDTFVYSKKTNHLEYIISFNNLGRKIKAFKGELRFVDLFGNKTKVLTMSVDKTIESKGYLKLPVVITVSDFYGNNKIYISDSYKNLRIEWVVENVIFE